MNEILYIGVEGGDFLNAFLRLAAEDALINEIHRRWEDRKARVLQMEANSHQEAVDREECRSDCDEVLSAIAALREALY